MKKISFICLLGLLLAINLYAEIAVDFNDISDLNTYFNNPNLEDVTNVSDMGIDNSGSVDTPYLYMGESRVVTLKTGIPMPAVNQPIRLCLKDWCKLGSAR